MAYQFNGSSQYCKTSSNPITSYPFSMSAWFYSVSATAYQTILHLGSPGTNEQSMYLQNGKAACASYFNGTGGIGAVSTSLSYSALQWTHVSAVFTSTGRSIFLSGSNKVTNSQIFAYSANLSEIDIGSEYYNNSYAAFMNGSIAEPAIWNVALTDTEIASLAAGFTPDQVRPQSLQFYAPLVRDLIDVRGGRAITNVNGATVAAHPRIIT